MKKVLLIFIAVIIVIVLAIDGYELLNRSNSTTPTTTGSSSTHSSEIVITKTSSNLGQFLAEPGGQPLYIYGGDSTDVSNCTGSCLTSWPAYLDLGATTGLPSGIGTIRRADNGKVQFTYNGMPLYTFVGDNGDQPTGSNVSNFTVAKPIAPSPSSQPRTNSSSAPTTNYTTPGSNSGGGW